MSRFGRVRVVPASLIAASIVAGCEADPITESARVGTLEYVSGNDQSGTVGLLLAEQLVVRLIDQFGRPVAGETVAFVLDAASSALGATAEPGSDITGSDGIASTELRLGTTTGPYRIAAAWPGEGTVDLGQPGSIQVVEFTATGGPAPPASLTITSGNNQTAPVNSLLPLALTVRVADAFNNPVPDVLVTFVVGSGGGQLSLTEATADASGIATSNWTLGPTAGAQSVTAFVPGATPVTFTATAQ